VTSVRARTVGGQTYYYLVQTARIHGRVRYRERYLGRKVPRDLEPVRQALLAEIRAEKWYPLLEEIRSAHRRELAGIPGSVRQEELERFGIEFTYNTNRIEGSSLTLRETDAVLSRGVMPKAKPLSDVLEARAHQGVYRRMLTERGPLDEKKVLDWHRALFESTKPELAGLLRTYGVGIGGSRFAPPPPEEVGPLFRALLRWYADRRGSRHPVEVAAILHVRFETIHPFGDGNGRVGRLLMNHVLHHAGYPMLDLPYEGREGYYSALERSHTSAGELSFLEWFLRTYVRAHRKGRPALTAKERRPPGASDASRDPPSAPPDR
jgi:Fic family protein